MCHLPWQGGKRDAAAASPLNCQCHLGSVIWGYHLSLLSSTKLWVVPWIFPLDVRGLTDPKLKPPILCPSSFLLVVEGRSCSARICRKTGLKACQGWRALLGGLTLGHFAGFLQQWEVPEMQSCQRAPVSKKVQERFPQRCFSVFYFLWTQVT